MLIENDMFSEETKKEIYDECISVKENIELVDNMFNNAIEVNGLEKVSLTKVTKLFVHRTKTVLEDFIEEKDADEMYKNSQIALKDMKNSMRKMTKNINTMIEQLYVE